VGVHAAAGSLVPKTNRAVQFSGKPTVTIPPGESVWSDAVSLPRVDQPQGRKLAVSFHIEGESGPMTWHAKAITTSYLTAPGAGSKGQLEDESAFPFTTTSWYFLDAVDMMLPADTRLIVAFGDSITDGTASTLNGDDRWPNVLARRLHAAYGDRFAVVNEGIGGNQVAGPAEYSTQRPVPGGPSALQRLDRDVLSLSGVTDIIWFEGINDFANNTSVETVSNAMKEGVARIRTKFPKARIIGATVITALGSTATHGSPAVDEKRKALNDFIRTSGTFEGVADFDRATLNPQTGGLRPEFVPESTTGGAGDRLHPNRAGYQAMGMSIDLSMFAK
jgi:lysophospholipase L1-like esterase